MEHGACSLMDDFGSCPTALTSNCISLEDISELKSELLLVLVGFMF